MIKESNETKQRIYRLRKMIKESNETKQRIYRLRETKKTEEK